jgi:hypothetical protein
MAKHQIFLIHGMGNFEPGWSGGIQKQMTDLFGKYQAFRDEGFANDFEFKEITYNQVFEAWRKQWKEGAAKAAEGLVADGLMKNSVAGQLVNLAGSPSGDGFLRTHVMDVVAYRFLLPMAQEVWRSVQNQILGCLKALPKDDAIHYSIISHSLGTAVAYEAFHAMMTVGAGDPGAPLGTAFRPDNVFMLSNVVKPLWNRGAVVYQPVMAPSLSVATGWCFRMANFGHALDPFARLDKFTPPDDWFAQMAPKSRVYQDVTIPAADLQDPNVHAFEHYLGHPMVHVPILRTLAGFQEAVTPAELSAALVQWRSKSLSQTALTKAQDKLKAMATNATGDWGKEINMLLALRELALASKLKDGES